MTILNTEMIMKDNFWFTFCVIILITLSVFAVITFFVIGDEFYKVIFIGLIWLILVLPFVIPKEIPTDNYKYEVILDDNYSAKELMNNYEILETRGDIYVIKEKVE